MNTVEWVVAALFAGSFGAIVVIALWERLSKSWFGMRVAVWWSNFRRPL